MAIRRHPRSAHKPNMFLPAKNDSFVSEFGIWKKGIIAPTSGDLSTDRMQTPRFTTKNTLYLLVYPESQENMPSELEFSVFLADIGFEAFADRFIVEVRSAEKITTDVSRCEQKTVSEPAGKDADHNGKSHGDPTAWRVLDFSFDTD